jgi:Tol biopolymer transport system component
LRLFVLRLGVGATLGGLLLIGAAFAVGAAFPRQAILISTDHDGTNKLYLMDIRRNIILKLSDRPVVGCCPVWSPDGQQIAFLSVEDSAAKIFLMDWHGGNPRRLTSEKSTNEGSPAWSPDSQQIAFVFVSLLTSRSAIFIAEAASGTFHPLTSEYANHFAPVWSPDGTHLLIASDLSPDSTFRLDAKLINFDLDDGDGQQLTDDDAYESDAAFSPDGEQIVFTTTPPDFFPVSIYRMDADGGGRSLISDLDVSRNTAARWSPDGTRILFLSHRDGDVELFTVDTSGQHLQQLTANGALDWLPSWSPDGAQIAFLSGRDGDSAVYVMDADGNHPQRLTPYPANDNFAAWQPGGR